MECKIEINHTSTIHIQFLCVILICIKIIVVYLFRVLSKKVLSMCSGSCYHEITLFYFHNNSLLLAETVLTLITNKFEDYYKPSADGSEDVKGVGTAFFDLAAKFLKLRLELRAET